MKIKTFLLEEKNQIPKSLAHLFNEDEYCIVDIETTGLSSKYHQVILIGILYNEKNSVVIKQLFAEHPKEEILILKEFEKLMRSFSYIITYNGASFDLPFLRQRFIFHKMPWSFEHMEHIDILQQIRKFKKDLALENLKLKTVEKFLGINRKDTISGKESVLLYKSYIINKSPALEKTILLHNYEDIYYLNKVMGIFDHISVENIFQKNKPLKISDTIDLFLKAEDVHIKKDLLHIKGKIIENKLLYDIVYYDTSCSFHWNKNSKEFRLEIPLFNGYLKNGAQCKYLNLKDFYLSKDNFNNLTSYSSELFPKNFMIIFLENNMIPFQFLEKLIFFIVKALIIKN